MVEYRLRDILSEINGTNWYWKYSVKYNNVITSGRVDVIYYNGALLIRWNEDSLRAKFGANPPLSFGANTLKVKEILKGRHCKYEK